MAPGRNRSIRFSICWRTDASTGNRASSHRRAGYFVLLAPLAQLFDHRAELAALFGQHIFRARRMLFIEALRDDADRAFGLSAALERGRRASRLSFCLFLALFFFNHVLRLRIERLRLALLAGEGLWLRLDAVHLVDARIDAAGLLQREPFAVAGADIVDDVVDRFVVRAKLGERSTAEFDRGFEGFANLVVHVLRQERERARAVERADIKLRAREVRLNDIDDTLGILRAVGADRDQARLIGMRRAQDVEPRPVAVVNLEAEARDRLHHLGVVVDHGHVDFLREQALRDDLAEAAEADDQHRAARLLEPLDLVFRLFAVAFSRSQPLHERRKRRTYQHREAGERDHEA